MKTRQNIAGGKVVEISARIPADLAKRLRQMAFDQHTSQAALIAEAITQLIEHRE